MTQHLNFEKKNQWMALPFMIDSNKIVRDGKTI
jgi:hypothetical protein